MKALQAVRIAMTSGLSFKLLSEYTSSLWASKLFLLEAGEIGRWRLGAGGWRLEAGELEARSWREQEV